MRSLHDALADADAHPVDASVRLEAVYHIAFAWWVMGDYVRAEAEASRALELGVDGIVSRATALRGWIRVGRSQYAQALPFFREARRAFTSVSRDAAFEASVVHALATYEWQLLEHDGEPHYYADELPRVHGSSLDTYRLLVGVADAWCAALAGDEYRAVAFAAQTEANEVSPHWRVFGLATRAGIARSFGHEQFARATADVGFTIATGADWSDSPGESRMALLYGAERLAGHDVDRARALLGAYARIATEVDPRYARGAHAFHQATEHHARGVVALAASDAPSSQTHLLEAHRLFTAVASAGGRRPRSSRLRARTPPLHGARTAMHGNSCWNASRSRIWRANCTITGSRRPFPPRSRSRPRTSRSSARCAPASPSARSPRNGGPRWGPCATRSSRFCSGPTWTSCAADTAARPPDGGTGRAFVREQDGVASEGPGMGSTDVYWRVPISEGVVSRVGYVAATGGRRWPVVARLGTPATQS
jgi:hypothetical protein